MTAKTPTPRTEELSDWWEAECKNYTLKRCLYKEQCTYPNCDCPKHNDKISTPMTDKALEACRYSYEDCNGQETTGYDIGVFKGKMQKLERELAAAEARRVADLRKVWNVALDLRDNANKKTPCTRGGSENLDNLMGQGFAANLLARKMEKDFPEIKE